MPFRVIIAGGRDFDDEKFLFDKMDYYLREVLAKIEIVSGHQKSEDNGYYYGADYFGEKYARARKFSLEIFPADWKKLGKKAGPIRNRKMGASGVNACVVFWDGKSQGSKNMIDICNELKIPLRIVKYPATSSHTYKKKKAA